MNVNPPLKDPNEVIQNIKHILDKNEHLYEFSPQEPNINVEIITERCSSEYCPLDHTVVKISADFMLGEDLLAICRYLKRNKIPFCYIEHSFKIILN